MPYIALTSPLPLPSCPAGTPGNQAWQQLWSSGGACTGMAQQDYFQLMADTFGAYDPAVSGKATYGGLVVAQQNSDQLLQGTGVCGEFGVHHSPARHIPAPTDGCAKHST